MIDNSQEKITKDLIQTRQDQHLSQRELARRADTTQAVISRVENMEVNPSVGLLERISFALGQSLNITTSPTVDKIKHKLVGEYQTVNNISVDSTALLSNFNFFSKENPQARIAPVLKSNAYGHGLELVGDWVDKNIEVPFICVDSLFEAYQLKNRGVNTPILVMGYTDPQNFKVFSDLSNIHFSIFDINSLTALQKYQPKAKIHLKIDTGMNRLGLLPNQISQFINLTRSIDTSNIVGIFSHFSQADSENIDYTQKQVSLFKQVIRQFESSNFDFDFKHISATAGSFLTKDKVFNIIRLGLGFYGYSPFSNKNSQKHDDLRQKLIPALTLTTKLIQTKSVGEGNQISYGGTHKTTQPTILGILPIGYYDGLSRRLSNKGRVYLQEQASPVIGNVTMNQTIIDVSKLNRVKVGDAVEIISPDIAKRNCVYSLAKIQNTIPYTTLTSLSETTKRIIK